VRVVAIREPDASWGNDAPEGVALGPDFDDSRPGRERPGSQLRTGQVHDDRALHAECGFRPAEVLDHRQPA
jgi:hypothetical protein